MAPTACSTCLLCAMLLCHVVLYVLFDGCTTYPVSLCATVCADDLPALVLPPMQFEPVLAPYSPSVNINDRILSLYVKEVLPGKQELGGGEEGLLYVPVKEVLPDEGGPGAWERGGGRGGW